MLDGGRIPLKLAGRLPLASCTEKAGCNCFYSAWPPSDSRAE